MKKPIIIIISLSCIVLALAVVRITLINSMSTTGVALVDLQNQVDEYKKENKLLQERYLQAASYTNVYKKAKAQGFSQSETALNLATPLPLAKR